MQQPSDRSAHSRRRPRIARAGWWVHLLGAIALVVGLFMPLVAGTPATAAPDSRQPLLAQSASDTVPPAPVQVSAVGDFPSAQLTNSNGIWTGVFAVPPGQYQWQIQAVAPDGTTYTYGPGGLGDGAGSVSVGDGEAGLYFSLNTHTNETVAAPVSGIYSVDVNGASVALQPSGGQLTAIVSGGGPASIQVFDGGAPLGEPQQADLGPGPNRLIFSPEGQLVGVESLPGGSVTIERLDANGAPLPGGCYQLRSGGIVNQGCDADDGADGYTTMTFPTGMPGGSVDVVEVTPPAGAEAIETQQIQLQGGDQLVTLQPAAVAPETPVETEAPADTATVPATQPAGPGEITQPGEQPGPPGDLLVELVDEGGDPIGGACFQIVDAGGNVVAQSCDQEPFDPADFANNGTTGFFGVPSGTYTLQLTQAPNGATADDRQVTVAAGQQTVETVTATGAAPVQTATAAPTQTVPPTQAPGPGDLTVTLVDGANQPIGGACFQLIDAGGNLVAEACDTLQFESEEFANNGNTGFGGVPAGTYTLRLSSAPEGVTLPDQPVTVTSGGDDTVVVTAQVAPTETDTPAPTATVAPTETAPPTQPAGDGDLTVTLVDQDAQPIGGACFQLIDGGGNVVQEGCDTTDRESAEFANNGNTGFFDIPAGTYTLRMSSAPDGVTPVADQPVTVVADIETTVTVTAQRAAAETPTPTGTVAPTEPAAATETAAPVQPQGNQPGPPANLVVELRDPATGAGIGGACFTLTMEGQPPITSCDADDVNPGNGRTGFFGIPSGTYELTESTVPAGSAAIEPQQVTIQPGENPDLVVEPAASLAPQADTGGAGTVVIDVSAIPGNNVCVELNTSSGISFANPPSACDNGDGDANDQPGLIEIRDVQPGEYVLTVVSGAGGIPDQPVTVSDSGPTQVVLGQEPPTPTPTVAPTEPPTPTPTPEPTVGTLSISVADASGSVGGACVDVANPSGTFTFCDEDGDGIIEIPDAVFGTQTITMSTVPGSYRTPEPQTVELNVDQQSAKVAFTLEAASGAVAVTVADANNVPIADACVAVDGGEPQCTGAEGTVTFEDVPVGPRTVAETSLPEGYEALEPVQVTVEDGQAAPASFQHPVPTGSIQVTSVNADGTPVAGACVAVDGGEPLCDVDGDGILIFEGVPVGGHEVTQTTPPTGYELADPASQNVGVGANQPATVTFTSAPATGGIAVTVTGPDGAVPGICVAVNADGQEGQTLCEPGDDGAYRFAGLAPATWTVTVSQVPETLVPPDAQTADVAAGQEATVAFELSEVPPQTGSALLSLESEDGQAASGTCVVLTPQGGGEPLGPFCDNVEGQDGDATEGVLLIQDIPAGSYEVTFPEIGAAGDLTVNALRQQGGEPIIIEIIAGQTIEQTIIVPGLFIYGSIEARTVDDATGDEVRGACFTVDTAEPTTVCDGGDGDGSTEDGTVLIGGLPAGGYTVTMSTPPENYSGADPQPATVASGKTVSLEFRVTAQVTTGSLTILKLDDGDAPLPGACFRLDREGASLGPRCDAADGADDGTIAFGEVPAGTWTLVETRTPSSAYAPAAPRQVTIEPGENLEIEVANSAAPGRLNVITVDAADPSVRLDNACYRLEGGTPYGPFCDGDDLSVDGRTVFTGVTPGTYTLVETQAPAGYDAAPNREVTIRAGVTHQITIQNQKTPPPPEAGTLVVNKLDEANKTLAGGCFRLFDGDSAVTGRVCDITDGTNDGRIVFENVPVGTWTLREVLAPSPSYQLAPDQQVTIENGKTTEVDIVDKLKLGRILVKKVTPQGGPIQGACFQLDPSRGDPRCSDASGQILFENIPVGTYTLNETTTPFGFKKASPVENVKVNPGQTTVVTVKNERQPPPNTGTVQVRKFVCPVDTAEQERTSFLGGAAGNAELAKTKGCAPANAEFTMVGQDGKDGPGAFRTGDDGVYIVTAPAKIYRLDETNPDLPGNSAALLRVDVGRMTTVVVINYVAPPAPEPVSISVAKYTCQAGFNGTTFEDFAASCMSDEQLTNNITVRAEGPVKLKAVTGDGGKAGRTAFVDQPSGTWTIYEERPYNIPTNYVFCGWNPNWPADFKSVNGSVTAKLGEGASLTCVLFNIPEPVTDSTGVILVRKYVCDVETPPKGYRYADECRLSDQNATFELKQFNEELQQYANPQQQVANPDGILRFINLRPGSYQLREVGDNWCYANSNSVNSKGDVVVKAGQVSLVSIYNCVGPSAPPNTGSGDAAGLLDPPAAPAPGGTGTTPGLAWPVGILAAVFALWPKRVLAPGRDGTTPDEGSAGDLAA